jgi:hypothetical protein
MSYANNLVQSHVLNILYIGALAKYFEAVKKIEFTEEPHYDNLRKILKEYLIKHKCEKAPLDW